MAFRIVRFDDPTWRQPGVVEPPDIRGLVERYFQPPGGGLLLAYDADTKEGIVGSAGFSRVTEAVCEARNVVVHWDHQKKGIGRALMIALLREAAAAGLYGDSGAGTGKCAGAGGLL